MDAIERCSASMVDLPGTADGPLAFTLTMDLQGPVF